MKKLIMCAVIALGFSAVANAFEGEEQFLNQPVQTQETYYTSADQADSMDMDINASSRYCCYQSHGGGYCDMGEYKKLSSSCKCYDNGSAPKSGFVCR